MTTNAIRYITALMALASGILAIGDKLSAMPGLPGWLTSSWPIVSAAALAFHTFAQTLVTPKDSAANKPSQGPTVPPAALAFLIGFAACLAIAGCATTTTTAKDGSTTTVRTPPTAAELEQYQRIGHSLFKDVVPLIKTSALTAPMMDEPQRAGTEMKWPGYRTPYVSHWKPNGELNQDNPPPLVRLLPSTYSLLTNGL